MFPKTTESKKWHERWAKLKARGIDGFTVGIPAGENPGAMTFDIHCVSCNEILLEDSKEVSGKRIESLFHNHWEEKHRNIKK